MLRRVAPGYVSSWLLNKRSIKSLFVRRRGTGGHRPPPIVLEHTVLAGWVYAVDWQTLAKLKLPAAYNSLHSQHFRVNSVPLATPRFLGFWSIAYQVHHSSLLFRQALSQTFSSLRLLQTWCSHVLSRNEPCTNAFHPRHDKLCVLGEHTDWAAGYRDRNPSIPPGVTLVATTNEGLHARINARADGRLVFSSSVSSCVQTRNGEYGKKLTNGGGYKRLDVPMTEKASDGRQIMEMSSNDTTTTHALVQIVLPVPRLPRPLGIDRCVDTFWILSCVATFC